MIISIDPWSKFSSILQTKESIGTKALAYTMTLIGVDIPILNCELGRESRLSFYS